MDEAPSQRPASSKEVKSARSKTLKVGRNDDADDQKVKSTTGPPGNFADAAITTWRSHGLEVPTSVQAVVDAVTNQSTSAYYELNGPENMEKALRTHGVPVDRFHMGSFRCHYW